METAAGAESSARATREAANNAEKGTTARRFTSEGPSRRRHGHLVRLYPRVRRALVAAMFRHAGRELPAASRNLLPTRVPDGERNARRRQHVEECRADLGGAPAAPAYLAVDVDEIDLHQPGIEEAGEAFSVGTGIIDAAVQ